MLFPSPAQVALKAAQKQLVAAKEPNKELSAKVAQLKGALEQAARDYKLVLNELNKIRQGETGREASLEELKKERDALKAVRPGGGPQC